MQPHFELPNDSGLRGRWQLPSAIPDDPSLPGLEELRSVGLAAAVPDLQLGDAPLELRLCNYVTGSRATFEVRAGDRRFAVKLYADDPTPEAKLYQKLARVRLAGTFGPRVPRLLAFDPDLRMVVLEWLDGRPSNGLVKEGHGARAGQLAATWLWHVSQRRIRLGPFCGAGRALHQAGMAVGALAARDRALGAAAKAVAKVLVGHPPQERGRYLVHGTLYARHILDLGGVPGVIDWNQSGQGPLEVDAGMFLATISRIALRHKSMAGETARAEETFLRRMQGLLDERTIAWYRSASLLHIASRGLKGWLEQPVPPEARAAVDEAARWAEVAIQGQAHADGADRGRRKRFWPLTRLDRDQSGGLIR